MGPLSINYKKNINLRKGLTWAFNLLSDLMVYMEKILFVRRKNKISLFLELIKNM